MATNFKQVTEIAVGTHLFLDKLDGDGTDMLEVQVIKAPYMKDNVWHITVGNVTRRDGTYFDDRKNFLQLIHYTEQGMFKIDACKLIRLRGEQVIITKGHLKLVNRRGSVRVPTTIAATFKIPGDKSDWIKATILDVSLTGCRLRTSMITLTEKQIKELTQNHMPIAIVIDHEDIKLKLIGDIQRIADKNRGVTEIGCTIKENSDYNRLVINEQVKMARVRRG